MATLDQIKRQIQAIGNSATKKYQDVSAVIELQSILADNERIIGVFTTSYANEKEVILFITDNRFIFCKYKPNKGLPCKVFSLSQIDDITYDNYNNRKVVLHISKEKEEFSITDKNEVMIFQTIHSVLKAQTRDTTNTLLSNSNSLISLLERLAELKEKSHLSLEEFEASKKMILSMLDELKS